jgi:ADP-heptose:LPS heptosyltransferase/GT2 family glycosyltransferase
MHLNPGDQLGCEALLEFAVSTALDRESDFLYADERRINPASGATEAWFKPQWSPDLLLSGNYVGRPWCARADLLQRAISDTGELLHNGEYDLVLRLTEQSERVRHVPAVLCQSSSNMGYADAEEKAALEAAVARRGIDGEIICGHLPGTFRLKRKLTGSGLVSIIIPTCAARGLIKTCIETLRDGTAYKNFEIVCIENIPDHQEDWKRWVRANADQVIATSDQFNWSRFNNLGVAKSRGEFLLFLNDDIEVVEPHWLEALLEHGQRAEVGAVGPQLRYPDGRVQHAGMFLAGAGIARHAFRYADASDPGYFGLALTQRNVIAVTGACLLTRRDTFEALGRFDETHDVVNNDLDYCLRVRRHNLLTVYTPYARLIHHELASRSEIGDNYDTAAFESQWRSVFLRGDPYFHPRLAIDRDDYSCEWEPVQLHYAGHPFLDREQICKILIVKLDHIGDCVIALPAVRRLQQHFPQAKLYVLSSRASQSIWSLEPCIVEVIEFDFFHARSGLGLIELSDEDWQSLEERLRDYHFDLAVDMRKHVESRQVLQHTGALYLAGFDQGGKFPWMDVAIEGAPDQPYFAKRQHMADELVNLVDAIAAACETDRTVIRYTPKPVPPVPDAQVIFSKAVVCVHPSAGNEMRQWPPEYFALLIDLLIEFDNVHVILIGGPDEAGLAQTILQAVSRSDAAWSLVGKTKVAELPALMTACALFIGNNSGPHHIAAGLGVPTLGIHSGVVDAREWGPLGPTAVAIARTMSCSPCYFSKMEECQRELACLRGLLPGDVHRACQPLLALGRSAPSSSPPPPVSSGRPSLRKRLVSMREALRKASPANRIDHPSPAVYKSPNYVSISNE